MLATLAQVALGGAIGASARHLTGVATRHFFGAGFPWGTFTVNVLGSALMGMLVVVLAKRGGTHLAPFLTIGVLGGFTTFSSFSLDAVALWERGETVIAAAYVLGSVVLSIAALFAGMVLMRSLLP